MGRNLVITHFTPVLLKTQCDLYPYMSCQNSLNTVSHALLLLLIKNLFFEYYNHVRKQILIKKNLVWDLVWWYRSNFGK